MKADDWLEKHPCLEGMHEAAQTAFAGKEVVWDQHLQAWVVVNESSRAYTFNKHRDSESKS
jgi:hypothetical protein